MNLINIENGKDLITLDFRTKEIRYLKNYKTTQDLYMIELTTNDSNGYKYLYNTNIKMFFKILVRDINLYLNKDINANSLKVI